MKIKMGDNIIGDVKSVDTVKELVARQLKNIPTIQNFDFDIDYTPGSDILDIKVQMIPIYPMEQIKVEFDIDILSLSDEVVDIIRNK